MEDFCGMTPKAQAEHLLSRIAEFKKSKTWMSDTKKRSLNGFKIVFKRRANSGIAAKRINYVYRGNITFLYGPERKEVTVSLLGGEMRSLKSLIEFNEENIVNRLKQHFELEHKPELPPLYFGWTPTAQAAGQ